MTKPHFRGTENSLKWDLGIPIFREGRSADSDALQVWETLHHNKRLLSARLKIRPLTSAMPLTTLLMYICFPPWASVSFSVKWVTPGKDPCTRQNLHPDEYVVPPLTAELNALQEELKPYGLVVLGFPCNQFGKQEPGDNKEILPGLK